MLRSQAALRRELGDGDGVGDVEDEELDAFVAVEVEDSSRVHEKELRRTDETFLWLLLLAAVAECVTTCFLPAFTFASWGLNVSATALNLIGPFLDGISYGYEASLKGAGVSLACMQFRSAFLGYEAIEALSKMQCNAGMDDKACLLLCQYLT
ncbi:hypothetical protein BBJ28_00017722 [Nothophytophthora sp. Chile5]|nr:hypothetical protein BBJ28_00017722 [Nothophytophthora sp. Chile5]